MDCDPSPRSRVIPVLDLKNGAAVRAVGGDRAHYRPLRTILHPSSDPVGVARAYRDVLGFRRLYVADLDAIAGSPPANGIYRELASLGLALWIDAGVHDQACLPPLLSRPASAIVVGLETVRGPAALARIVDRVGGDRLVFSLDLRAGVPMVAEGALWPGNDVLAIADAVIRRGVSRILLLDLARVGEGQGTGTTAWIEHLSAAYPATEIACGGGIATAADVPPLFRAGASAVLIGSALHSGGIGTAELTRLSVV
jgi:phosphoribosylformimino-5-aminoimidazole carboxamide ribotide isomerase